MPKVWDMTSLCTFNRRFVCLFVCLLLYILLPQPGGECWDPFFPWITAIPWIRVQDLQGVFIEAGYSPIFTTDCHWGFFIFVVLCLCDITTDIMNTLSRYQLITCLECPLITEWEKLMILPQFTSCSFCSVTNGLNGALWMGFTGHCTILSQTFRE
jgi:hypothetical protein